MRLRKKNSITVTGTGTGMVVSHGHHPKKRRGLFANAWAMLALTFVVFGSIGAYLIFSSSAATSMVSCTSIGSGKYNCNWYQKGTPVYKSGASIADSNVVDHFNSAGSNWIYCQRPGAYLKNTSNGKTYTNLWWGYTLGDNGKYGWVNAVYASTGTDNQPFNTSVVPMCTSSSVTKGANPPGWTAEADKNVVTPVTYSGNNDGCGGYATHYNDSAKSAISDTNNPKKQTHVGPAAYGANSVCKCDNSVGGKYVAFQSSIPDSTNNPNCKSSTTPTTPPKDDSNISTPNCTKVANGTVTVVDGKCVLKCNSPSYQLTADKQHCEAVPPVSTKVSGVCVKGGSYPVEGGHGHIEVTGNDECKLVCDSGYKPASDGKRRCDVASLQSKPASTAKSCPSVGKSVGNNGHIEDDGKGNGKDSCIVEDCKAGFHANNAKLRCDANKPPVCTPVTNGIVKKVNGKCILVSCKSGYHKTQNGKGCTATCKPTAITGGTRMCDGRIVCNTKDGYKAVYLGGSITVCQKDSTSNSRELASCMRWHGKVDTTGPKCVFTKAADVVPVSDGHPAPTKFYAGCVSGTLVHEAGSVYDCKVPMSAVPDFARL